jgi:hypothetical protein
VAHLVLFCVVLCCACCLFMLDILMANLSTFEGKGEVRYHTRGVTEFWQLIEGYHMGHYLTHHCALFDIVHWKLE